ncbi:MAG: exo-alpha-sialidase [Bryobacterales bacterium]|nr:exo-alpha-sialidase [Bryobacterales bacterium]
MRLSALSFLLAASLTAAELPVLPLSVELGPEQVIAPGVPWPYLARTAQGSLVLFGHVGWPKGGQYPIHYLSRSFDGGKSWQEWKHSAQQGRGPVTEGSSVQLRDGTFLFFDVHAENKGNQKFVANYWSSRDGMKTIEGPFPFTVDVPLAVGSGVDDRGVPINRIYFRRSVIELPSGDLLASVYGWFAEDKFPVEYLAGMKKVRSYVVVSKDKGKTWQYVSTIASQPWGQEGLGEPVIERLSHGPAKGRLVCILRSGRENPMYQTESDDDGKTWSPVRKVEWSYSRFGRVRELVGTDPDLIEMSDGTLVLAYGHKPDYLDDGNFLAFSLDQGRTWSQVVRLSSPRSMAYTGLRETAPGELYLVYTNANGDTYDIVGRVVKVKRK